MSAIGNIVHAFIDGYCHRSDCSPQEAIREEQELREHLSEKQIDKTIQDSFPASDPPSTY